MGLGGRVVSEFSSTSLFAQLLSSEPGEWLVKPVSFTPSCLRRGTGGDRDPRRWVGRKRETIPNAICHHQNECSKDGSDESHFNVLLIVRGENHKTASTDHNF